MTSPVDRLDALTSPASAVSPAEAEAIAATHYGIVGKARRLAGEKDDNFALDAEAASYLLKVVHPGEPAEVTDLSTTVLSSLSNDLPLQQIVRTRDGRSELVLETSDGVSRRARMTTYLAGRPLHLVPSTVTLRENLGRTLARLGLELRAFTHPAAERPLWWDLSQAELVRPLLGDLTELSGRRQLFDCLDGFTSSLRPRLAALRRQVIHNDLSGDNLLIGDDGVTVVGILDFGDVVLTQLINDVAVAVTNQLSDDDDPIAPGLDLVRGFHAVVPLQEAELEVLYELVRLRTVVRIIISEWRARRFPENRKYILRNTPRAWSLLERLPASGGLGVTARFIETCQLD